MCVCVCVCVCVCEVKNNTKTLFRQVLNKKQ